MYRFQKCMQLNGVYGKNGANPAVEIIPLVSAHLWPEYCMINIHEGKAECDDHLWSCFHSS